MAHFETLLAKIQDHTARVGVIGLGYVGLPLAATFGQNGYTVMGIDVDRAKLTSLSRGESYIQDVPADTIRALRAAGRFAATDDYGALRACDVVFICVPTPMTEQKSPDMTFIESAARGIAG